MSETLLLGTRKGLFTLVDDGRGYAVTDLAHAGIPVQYAMRDARDGTIWAALDHGHWGAKLARKRVDGAWEEVQAPAYPDGEVLKTGAPATLEQIWIIAEGGEDNPDRLYIGTNPGGLFVSEDRGDTWELVRGLWDHPTRLGGMGWFGGGRDTPGIHSILVDPRYNERVLVGISCAGVFETADGGATWIPRNHGVTADFLPDPTSEVGVDPHFVAMSPTDPEVLWQQNHCGIWVSRDGATRWTAVHEPEGPAKFGFPICVHPDKPGTAWVIPGISDGKRMAIDGKLMVLRTDDFGETWTSTSEGLPQENAWDIVFRHAFDNRGERLAFGSTTGNAFVSTDGGSRWTSLGNHFPPVYSVRFA
ncbi:MAG: glycosyl hydrolase [Deltaproteobacteria bacterium]|nr:MAG: glycosyl hydrolase [Deltaproteobacteria bacterium]